MRTLAVGLDQVLEVLGGYGEDGCLAWLEAIGGRGGTGVVELVEGELTAEEALAYAAVLLELGRSVEAAEVVAAAVLAVTGHDPLEVEVPLAPAGWGAVSAHA